MTISESKSVEPSIDDIIMEVEATSVDFDMERGRARVLNEVSIDIKRNEILGVIGESGSGKSMLASAMLNAVVDPGQLSGEITFYPEGGEPVPVHDLVSSDLKELRWEQISMVFQGAMSSFNPVQSLRDHFVETLSAHNENIDEGMERAEELLSDLHLDPNRILDSYPHELSGGMQQRTLIALSLILEPEVLVMDEPTAALDLLMQQSIIELIDDIKERYDLTIVFITHDLPLVAGLADRLGVLYAFEFVELGPADDILTNPSHPYTQALLQSTPNISDSLDQMRPIEGESPDPVNIPSGCSYHPRCPFGDEQCETTDPPMEAIGTTHSAACHYWEEVRENPIDEVAFENREHSSKTSVDRTTDEPLLSLTDIEVYFEQDSGGLFGRSDPNPVKAVDGVSLDIYEYDVVVLVGESGCGKTTLGKTAVGLQRPTGGTVEYRGQDYWEANDLIGDITIPWEEIRRELQIIHQDPGSSLNSNRRVRSILEAPLKRWHPELDGNDRIQRILGMLEYVGMTPAKDYIERYPHQLSGGEKQRVALIRAMLIDPDVILADEAVSALDVSLRVEMMDLMIELQNQFGTSFIFISHNLSNARYLAEKMGGQIGVMYLGEVVEIGPPDQIVNDPNHPYTEALRWATPNLDPNVAVETRDRPIRTIDIPDPSNAPSGCRYHTRCPEAREICRTESPQLQLVGETDLGEAACFRTDPDHEYWESEPISDDF